MKIVFFGTPHFVIPILEVLLKTQQVVGVVTASDHTGRKGEPIPSPVKKAYQDHLNEEDFNKPHPPHIFTPDKLTTITHALVMMQPDLFVTAAYGKILPEEILEIPHHGAINVHPSLLPKYRGPSPITATILNGDTTTGVSIIQMDTGVDHGPIIASSSLPVHPTDTHETLANHLFGKAAEMLPDVIDTIAKRRINYTFQDHDKATYTHLVKRENGYFDLENPPGKEKLDRMIRAYYPWPTAWSKVRIKNSEFRIKFLPGPKVQMEGKNPMTIKEFLNGYPQLRGKIENLFQM